jgi:nitrogen regulatory protein P-II 1
VQGSSLGPSQRDENCADLKGRVRRNPPGLSGKSRETHMKLISSLVRPDKVDAVKEALRKVNVVAFAIAEARDHSPQTHETMVWMGHVRSVGSSLKMEIRLVVHDDDVDEVIDAIMRSARTGRVGDGHVCVASIDHRYEISTGQRDV